MKPTKPVLRTTSSSTGVLYLIAYNAYSRVKADPVKNREDALVAVLFSAVTLEAFMTDLIWRAKLAREIIADAPKQKLDLLIVLMDTLEDRRISVRSKYLVFKHVVSEETYEKGRKPFQDFETLMTLRDEIVHLKPEVIEPGFRGGDKLLARLPGNRPQRRGETESWISTIMTPARAKWACNTVVEMVKTIDDCFSKTPKVFTQFMTSHALFPRP